MKNHVFSFLLFFFAAAFGPTFGQEVTCLTTSTASAAPQNPPNACGDLDFATAYQDASTLTINVNIHWFARTDGTNLDPATGLAMAQLLLDGCNAQQTNLPVNSKLGNTGLPITHVPDSKWRLALYSNPAENPDDLYGGVFFHPFEAIPLGASSNQPHPYGNKCVDIYLVNDFAYNAGGTHAGVTPLLGNGYIAVYNVAYNLTPGSMFINSRVINHEIGHYFGLDHCYVCSNICGAIPGDLDTKQECDNGGHCMTNETPFTCIHSNSNNLMAQSFDARAITPCQWARTYRNIASSQKIGNCASPNPDIVIENGEHAVWENLKIVLGNVRVKTGGQLTIRCSVLMADNKGIIVEKGAKLNVEGAVITSLCNRWRGIQVWGNPNIEQPSPDVMPQAHESGVAILITARILNAECGVYAGKPSAPNEVFFNMNGGVVVAKQQAHFENCGIGVHLPRFRPIVQGNPAPNKSKFHNVSFETNGVGVQLGGSDGIKFELCRFKGPNSQLPKAGKGILMVNSQVEVVNQCKFEDLVVGIEALSTHQYATQLSVISEGNLQNQFATCKIGLALKGIDQGSGLTFLNNLLLSCTIGIGIEGASNYLIAESDFLFGYVDIHLRNTASLYEHQVICNRFDSGKCCNIYADGKQERIWLDGNAFFAPSSTINFYLTGNAANPGQVGASLSGEGINPVKNFFYHPESSIITEGATAFFEYQHEPGASGFYLPLCDIDDIGCTMNNNFQNKAIDGAILSCSGGRPAPDSPTITDENVLDQPLKRQLGYRLYRQDYAAAGQIIASLPSATHVDSLYRQVQEINLASLSQDGFIPSAVQAQFLDDVSKMNLPDVSPYAEGVLRTSNSNALDWPVPACPRSGGRIQQPLQERRAVSVKISPNPANIALEVRLDGAGNAADVELTNLMGTVLRRTTISGSTPVLFETSSLPSGIYLLHSKVEDQAVQVQKVIIQH